MKEERKVVSYGKRRIAPRSLNLGIKKEWTPTPIPLTALPSGKSPWHSTCHSPQPCLFPCKIYTLADFFLPSHIHLVHGETIKEFNTRLG
jgi:hypothetical protein